MDGVPALLIGNDMVIGFDRRKIEELVLDKIVACDKCHAKLRVPSGSGTLLVTCSQCGSKFKADT